MGKEESFLQICQNNTSFLAFERASSSEETAIERDSSEEYRLTTDVSSIIEEVLPYSPRTVRSFFRTNDGGEPKSGPEESNYKAMRAENARTVNL